MLKNRDKIGREQACCIGVGAVAVVCSADNAEHRIVVPVLLTVAGVAGEMPQEQEGKFEPVGV